MSQDIPSKDVFFAQLARLSDEMIAAYDKDFAMGALVLAARFIAERDRAASDAGTSAGQQPPAPPTVLQ
jgi:hypothetical protein